MVGGLAGLIFFTVMGMAYLTAQGDDSDEEASQAFWPHAICIGVFAFPMVYVLLGMA